MGHKKDFCIIISILQNPLHLYCKCNLIISSAYHKNHISYCSKGALIYNATCAYEGEHEKFLREY